MPVELQRLRDAQRVLAAHFSPTTLVRAATLSDGRCDVYLKDESQLPTGSFKVRGAIYALSARRSAGAISEVVAASTGNHGAAVAHAGRLLGIRPTIFLPAGANPVKIARIRALGARIVEGGSDLAAAIDAANTYAIRQKAFFLHDASDPDIPAGAGTIGLEVVSQLPDVDVIYVPMGDTALVRGVASAVRGLRPSTQVVGVVAERAPAYYLSWRTRTPVSTETADTIADGLAVTRPLDDNVREICELVDRVVQVGEDALRASMVWLATREHIVAEPAGAAATAAFRRDAPASGRVVLLVTGGNIAPDIQQELSL